MKLVPDVELCKGKSVDRSSYCSLVAVPDFATDDVDLGLVVNFMILGSWF